MLIHQFGGEKKIIKSLVKPIVNHKEVICGPGDDCAVIALGRNKYQVISSDMYTDGDHFSIDYFTPLQIGKKVTEASLSDIAAMGGKAKYLFLNLSLKKQMKMSFVRSIFRGIYHSCDRYQVLLTGGDMVKSSKLTISVTVVGEVDKKNLCLRSGAQKGDLIKVTGNLGGAFTGYTLLKLKYLGHEKTKNKHLEPRCRLDLVDQIAPYATAMQDISDGLGNEVKHIAQSSHLGATIYKKKIPIASYVYRSAKTIQKDPYQFALYGGEDFELIYTVNPKNAKKTPGVEVGEMTENKEIIILDEQGEKSPVLDGFQHF